MFYKTVFPLLQKKVNPYLTCNYFTEIVSELSEKRMYKIGVHP